MPKTAIVTGASRGIGKAVAKRLARDGFAIVVNYASNAKEADATVAEIKSDERLRRIPVVVLTTSQAEQDILKSYNSSFFIWIIRFLSQITKT